jgi:hypothetical protein
LPNNARLDHSNLVSLEDSWRRQVEEAKSRYFDAVEQVKAIELRTTGNTCGFELIEAHRRETAARDDYMRVLHAFTDLVVHKRGPGRAESTVEDSQPKARSGGNTGG